jgi:hypothetical protein
MKKQLVLGLVLMSIGGASLQADKVIRRGTHVYLPMPEITTTGKVDENVLQAAGDAVCTPVCKRKGYEYQNFDMKKKKCTCWDKNYEFKVSDDEYEERTTGRRTK